MGVTVVNYLLPVEHDTLLSARRNRRLEARLSSNHPRRASGKKRSADKAVDGAVLGGVIGLAPGQEVVGEFVDRAPYRQPDQQELY